MRVSTYRVVQCSAVHVVLYRVVFLSVFLRHGGWAGGALTLSCLPLKQASSLSIQPSPTGYNN